MKAVLYELVNEDLLVRVVDGEIPEVQVTAESINAFLAVSLLIAKLLNIESTDLESFFLSPEAKSIMKQVTYSAFYHSNSIYVPYSGLNARQAASENDPKELMLERFRLVEGLAFTEFTEFTEFSIYKNPDFLLFHCMDYSPWSGISEILYGGFFVQGSEKWNHYYYSRGQIPSPEALASAKGILITGSRHCSFDKSLLWIDPMGELMREFKESGKRIVGICFGHQFLAKTFGGETAKNPGGNYMYKQENCRGKGRSLSIMESHGDCISRLPEKAVCLYSSESCEFEVVSIEDKVLSTQGHPEFTPYFVKNFHSKIAVSRGILSPEFFERIQNNFYSESDSLSIIETLNNFLKLGIINFN